jgi:hypothetical protein
MASQQYPTAQLTVGGQPTAAADFAFLSGYEVISATPGYQKDEDNNQNAAGTHRCRLQLSKRKTWSMELEAHSDTTLSTVLDAEELTDISGSVWDVVSAVATKTRSVTVIKLELIKQTDELAELA